MIGLVDCADRLRGDGAEGLHLKPLNFGAKNMGMKRSVTEKGFR